MARRSKTLPLSTPTLFMWIVFKCSTGEQSFKQTCASIVLLKNQKNQLEASFVQEELLQLKLIKFKAIDQNKQRISVTALVFKEEEKKTK